jgi:hypothetical protein
MSLIQQLGHHWQQWRARYLSSLLDSDIPWRVRWAALWFRPSRADYYQYLADLLKGTSGTLLLTSVFEADVERYGRGSRGVLSAHWLDAFARHGGRVSHTFAGTLPAQDVLMIRVLEERDGPNVLEEGLKEMSANVLLGQQAMAIFYGALVKVGLPLMVVLGMLVMIPTFSVPELKINFAGVPPANYPPAAKELFALSDFLSSHAVLMVVGVAALVGGCIASLSRLRGPLRPYFDRFGMVWGIYRDLQAIRLLTSLALILKKRQDESGLLDEALAQLRVGAAPWLGYQIDAMRQGIADNLDDQDVFDVNIMDQKMTYYLQDLIVSKHLDEALVYIRPRLETSLLKTMAKRASRVSFVLMILAAFGGLYLVQMHNEASSGLQQAMFNRMY